jgi:hypothetical protein
MQTAGNQRVVVCTIRLHSPYASHHTAARLYFAIFNSGHSLHTNCYQFTDPRGMDGLVDRVRSWGLNPRSVKLVCNDRSMTARDLAHLVTQTDRACMGHTGAIFQCHVIWLQNGSYKTGWKELEVSASRNVSELGKFVFIWTLSIGANFFKVTARWRTACFRYCKAFLGVHVVTGGSRGAKEAMAPKRWTILGKIAIKNSERLKQKAFFPAWVKLIY